MEGEVHWPPQRVVNCARAISVTMEESRGGWAPLIEFAQTRKKQNQAKNRDRKSKRKGERELNGLCCSIDYDRAKAKEREGKGSNKGGRAK